MVPLESLLAWRDIQLAGPVRDHLHHCFVEFFVAYQVVLITIDLVHDLVPQILVAFLESGLA